MNGMLDVAIGLIFVYLLLSLLCTTVTEALEQAFKYRAYYLRIGIEKLLFGGNASLRDTLYAHPLVKSLYTETRLPALVRTTGPSYIPSRQFVLALLDIVAARHDGQGTAGSPVRMQDVVDGLTRNGARLPAPLVGALNTLIADAGQDFQKVKAGVEQWFNGAMDRVAGWYKRRSQTVGLIVGLAVAVVVNADTLEMIRTLSNDSAVRASLVAAAQGYAEASRASSDRIQPGTTAPPAPDVAADVKRQSDSTIARLGGLGLPIGWRRPGADDVWSHLLGWLMTGFALSLGAPFWFDVLNKVMVVRATVKPHEKSLDEGSKDAQPGATQTVRIEVAAPPGEGGGAARQAGREITDNITPGARIVIDLYKQPSNELLGSVTEADLQVLIDALEEESADDQDYYITPATIDVIADGRASDHLVGLLRKAVGDGEGVDIRWSRR